MLGSGSKRLVCDGKGVAAPCRALSAVLLVAARHRACPPHIDHPAALAKPGGLYIQVSCRGGERLCVRSDTVRIGRDT